MKIFELHLGQNDLIHWEFIALPDIMTNNLKIKRGILLILISCIGVYVTMKTIP